MLIVQSCDMFVYAPARWCVPSLPPYMNQYHGAHITGCGSSAVGTRGQTLGALALMIPFYVLAPSGP